MVLESTVDIKQYMLDKYVPAKLSEPTLEVVFLSGSGAENECSTTQTHGQEKCTQLSYPFAQGPLTALPLKAARCLVEANMEKQTKRVIELTLDIGAKTCFDDFQPGDTIGILPTNTKTEVEQVLCALELHDEKADSSCQVRLLPTATKKSAKALPAHIPTPTTPRELLRDCLNLHAVLKKQFLRALAGSCAAPEERDFLSCLSAKEASAQYNALILERGFNLLELLQVCGTCRPTLALLVEHLPRLLPRPYSISSSPLANANEMRLIFSLQEPKKGVTTQMLDEYASSFLIDAALASESSPKLLPAYLRQSNKFRYTAEDRDSNQILIAIGTGLAPFLGFLEHKQHLLAGKAVNSPASKSGETWLFAGAATADSLLQREHLLRWSSQPVENGQTAVLQRYFESFSRDADAPFAYIQQQLSAHASEFVEFLLQPQTVLYVCADGAKISKSIEAAVCASLIKVLTLTEAEAAQMLKEFRASGKYREDLWT